MISTGEVRLSLNLKRGKKKEKQKKQFHMEKKKKQKKNTVLAAPSAKYKQHHLVNKKHITSQ